VRFSGVEEKAIIECGPINMAAPGFGPRPPCYVPDWSPTQWLQPNGLGVPQQVLIANPPMAQMAPMPVGPHPGAHLIPPFQPRMQN